MRIPVPSRRSATSLAAIFLALAAASCAWKVYPVTRTIREVTGAKARLHVIVPIKSTLRTYRVIEVKPLGDLVGGRVPPAMGRYLNEQIATQLRDLPTGPTVVKVAPTTPAQTDDGSANLAAAAVLDGYLEDYDAGSRSLRIVELGFNHIAVTVRIQLRDKQSGGLLGAASVTAEDDRASGTTAAAIDHAAGQIREFMETGYAR
jgi:hypothetical protein